VEKTCDISLDTTGLFEGWARYKGYADGIRAWKRRYSAEHIRLAFGCYEM